MNAVETISKSVNGVLNRLGVQVKRISCATPLLEKLIATDATFKFVQVGANDGVRFDDLFSIVTANRCPGLVIEPLPDTFAKLRNHYSPYPEVIPANIAIHPTAQSMTMYRVKASSAAELPDWATGLASLQEGHIEKHGFGSEHVEKVVVDCAPLMQVLTQHAMTDARYLQVDTEGFDFEVLKMIDFATFKPSLIKFESKHLSAADKASARTLLEGHGYRVMRDWSDTVAWLER